MFWKEKAQEQIQTQLRCWWVSGVPTWGRRQAREGSRTRASRWLGAWEPRLVVLALPGVQAENRLSAPECVNPMSLQK